LDFLDSIWNPCGRVTCETQILDHLWSFKSAYVAWADILGIDCQRRLDSTVRFSAFGNVPTGKTVAIADGALV
jgi:hypothetical protein